jgi:hypothetical protein
MTYILRKYWLLISATMLFALLLSAEGCRPVKKDSSSEKAIKDTTSLSKSSSGQVVKSDSVSVDINTQAAKSESKTTESGSVTARFKDGSAASNAPVTIRENADGSVTVDPGGRQLESVTTRNRKQQQKKDSTGTQQKQVVKTGSIDSTYQSKVDSSAGHQVKVKATESVDRKALFPWYVWLIGGGVLLILLYLIFLRIKIL